MIALLLATLCFVAALYAPRFIKVADVRVTSAESRLRRYGPMLVGVISPLIIWWVWDQVVPVPVIHDEASYLLQADIFATGRWTAPTPPMPEFFEQPHVQLVPALASKYPPGHALLLALGSMVGFRTLVPLLLTGVTAALLFALVARLVNPWVACVSWTFWLTSATVLRFQPSYLSELTTAPLVLGSWWALLEWRASRKQRWLLSVALMIGWGAITRPLTMLVFAVPIGVVVLRDVWRLRLWRDFALALAIGVAVLAILPLWSSRTTGDWRLSPVEKYRRDYLPFDKIGFVADTSTPLRRATMSKVLVETYDYFLEARREQSLRALPRTTVQRILALTSGFFDGKRLPLLLFALAGLFFMGAPLRFAAASAALLFVVHLPYAHWPGWTVYYLETAPVVAVITGLGLWHVASRIAPDRSPAPAMVSAALVIAVMGWFDARQWRDQHRGPGALHRDIARLTTQLPQPAILFVRYSPRIMHNPAVVQNFARPEAAGVWIVHDLGERNAGLLKASPGRVSHVLDVDRMVRPVSP